MDPKTYPITAYYVAKSLPLAQIEKRNELALLTKRRNYLVFHPGPERVMIVYSFGVVVLFNFDPETAKKTIRQVADYGYDPLEEPKQEDYSILVKEGEKIVAGFDSVVLPSIQLDKTIVIGEVLAQSVAIDYVEERVGRIVEKLEKFYGGLERGGRIRATDKEVMKVIGSGRGIVQYVITQLSLLDKPEIAWEEPELESLFLGMRRMFELEDRFKALEFRLNFIHDTSSMVLDVLQNKRSNNLEIWIIVLFIIDLGMVFYEILFK